MDRIKDLITQVRLFCAFDVAVAEKLEEIDQRLYALEQDNKRGIAARRVLEKQYSDLLYALRSLKLDTSK